MNRVRFSPALITVIILILIFMASLFVRVYFPFGIVFSGDWIKFTGVDAYYHMRLVDNLLSHFPQHLLFDPYTLYPNGHVLFWPPLYDWLLASVIWIAGLGSISQHLIDIVGVYFPAAIGALTVVPAYFIGKELFNRWVGLMSAGLIAVLPGYISISSLGHTDHHVAETLFSTITFLFMILAIKTAKGKKLNFSHINFRNLVTINRPLTYSILTGVFLGIYLLTAPVGLMLVFLIFVFFVFQIIVDHLRNRHTDYLFLVGTLTVGVSALISLPLLPHESWLSMLYLPSFIIIFLTALILPGISMLMRSRQTRPIYFPLTIIAIGLAGLGVFYLVAPSLLFGILDKFRQFLPNEHHTITTINETRPLFNLTGEPSLSLAWSYFTTGFFISLVILGILTYKAIKQGDPEKGLLVVWSLGMLVATLVQLRFSYYFVVNVAIMSGYLSWHIIRFTSSVKTKAIATKSVKNRKAKRSQFVKPLRTRRIVVTTTLGIVVVFFLVFFPNIFMAVSIAKAESFAPGNDWYQALDWFKDNSPEPFGDPSAYYQLYQPPKSDGYHYPESAYSVVSWVDYGHWITRIAHRIPIASPFQKGIKDVSEILTTEDEPSANMKMDKLDAKYIIIDGRTLNFLSAMATLASEKPRELYGIYYLENAGVSFPVLLYYPEFYRSLAIHLFLFDGGDISEGNPQVVSYVEKRNPKGELYKVISDLKSFSNYEEAKSYISRQQSGNYRIVSNSIGASPVPIVALDDYKLIYQSDTHITELPLEGLSWATTNLEQFPTIKIFEYTE